MDATEATGIEGAPSRAASSGRSIAPSWVNRLIWWVDDRPGPWWAWYAGAAAVMVLIANSGMWAVGRLEPGTFDLTQSYYGVIPVLLVLVLRYLDGAARTAADTFRPLLTVDEPTFHGLVTELTVIPARPALIVVGAMLVLTAVNLLGDPKGARIEWAPPWFLVFRYAAEVLVSSLFLLVAYHTVRQLRCVTRIHTLAARIDLFRPAPLHAFAGLTTRTAIVVILLVFSSVAADIEGWRLANAWTTVPWFGGGLLVAALAFTLPLQGIHRRIAAQKRELQEANAVRLTGTTSELHAVADSGDLTRVDGLNKLFASLIAERDLLSRLPTWPWQPGQIGAVVSAILLPVVLFVVTRLVGSAIGG